ncbi:acetyltransferase [Streptomyces sp. RB6PN25]|uniref:Lysine N-acyltransferase MbtK n=1 Tax=Streptomyces humicola TaxID=2953240 RepID=A0ABT1PZ72_9ACTN|nr:GNAT family N-acetyltransferase [Streptomyces humicola]MCQ4082966.1 acetyltransferase [Streptomyces humicola]
MPPTESHTHTEAETENGTDTEDTLDLTLPAELAKPAERFAGLPPETDTTAPTGRVPVRLGDHDLLDSLAEWGPETTPHGTFQLVPVVVARDLPTVTGWMNDPAVAEFWELSGPPDITEKHLREQIDGDGRSVPCLGVLDGTPMSYWEIYRADLDPVARYYPVRPNDTGIHLLIGRVADRGRGLGSALLRTVADQVLDHRPGCARVIAEPDLRNNPSVAAFLTAGFRFAAEIDLPEKRAALVIRDRALRHLL